MLGLFREGYGRDVFALFVLSVLLGSALVGAVGQGVQHHFEGAVSGLVGAPGEYDLLVHLRTDVGVQGVQALEARLADFAPGAKVHAGPDLAGRMNLFVGLPDAFRTRQHYESVHAVLAEVPGFDGFTFVVEPSVIVKETHPSVRAEILAAVDGIRHARFAFSHGNALWVVVTAPEHAESVRRELERLTNAMAVVDVRFPIPLDPIARADVEDRILAGIRRHELAASAEVLYARDDQEAARARDLVEVRRLLDQVSLDGEESLATKLADAAALIERSGVSGGDIVDASMALNAFYDAVDQIVMLQDRLVNLSGQLEAAARDGQATDVLIALLLQNLVSTLGGGGARDVAPPAAVDPEDLRAGLDALAGKLTMIDTLDLSQISGSLRQLEGVVSGFDKDALERASAAIDRLIALEGPGDQRVEVLGWGLAGTERVVSAVRDALPETVVDVYVRPAALVEPDARTALSLVIDRAGRIIELLVALLATAVFFFLDASTVLSFLRTRASVEGGNQRRSQLAVCFAGGVWCAALMSAMVWLGSGGAGTDLTSVAAVGFAFGALLSLPVRRVSQVDPHQLQAATSLGLCNADTLREVVIPGARPGLLQWLNQGARTVRSGA